MLAEHGPVHPRGGSPVAVGAASAPDATRAVVAPAPRPRPLSARTFIATAGAADDPRLRLLAGRVRVLGGQLHVAPPARGDRGARRLRQPERRRLRTISPLWLACALLFAGAVAEQVVLDPPTPWALVLPVLPLLAPRAPIAAAVTLAVAALTASAADLLAPYAVTPDFVASLVLLVIGAYASRGARSPAC